MAEDEFVQRAKKNGIIISRSPTPSEDPPTSSKMTTSPTPQEKKATALTSNSNQLCEEAPPAKSHEQASSQQSFGDDLLEAFETDIFADERTMQVQREIQRARAEGERRNQEYEFIMARRPETQRMNPAYQGWMGLPHPVDAGIRKEMRPAVDQYAMRALNEQYNKQYPFSPAQAWESEDHASLDEQHHRGEANRDVSGRIYNINAPNGFNSLDGAFDQARIKTPIPDKFDPKALAFRPSLSPNSTSTSNQIKGQKPKLAEPDKLNPTALSFSPRPKPETPHNSKDNGTAPATTDKLDPKALSFRPSPNSEASASLYSHPGHDYENSPSEEHDGSVVSKRQVAKMIKYAMYRHVGNPEYVSWDGKAVLLRMKGGLYSAQLTYVGPCDETVGDESQELEV